MADCGGDHAVGSGTNWICMIAWDQSLFLTLNGWNSPAADIFWAFITHRLTWIPLYVGLIVWLLWKVPKGWIVLLYLLFAVGASDRFTSGFMKPTFQRLRPCHDPELASQVHVIGSCGGKYGFASSHAANTFSLAMGFGLVFPARKRARNALWGWAILVTVSRIFVGVHFPADLLVGAGVGSLIAWLFFQAWRRFKDTP